MAWMSGAIRMRCALMLGEDQRDAADDAEAEAEAGAGAKSE